MITEYRYSTVDLSHDDFWLGVDRFRDIVKQTHLKYNDRIVEWQEERDPINKINIGHIFSRKEEVISISKANIGYISW